jgi:hypothetical protein
MLPADDSFGEKMVVIENEIQEGRITIIFMKEPLGF